MSASLKLLLFCAVLHVSTLVAIVAFSDSLKVVAWCVHSFTLLLMYWAAYRAWKQRPIPTIEVEKELLRLTLAEVSASLEHATAVDSTYTYKEAVNKIQLIVEEPDIKILINNGQIN